MAPRPDRTVKVVLDRPRRLRYNNTAIVEFEDRSGEDLLALAKTPKRFQSFKIQNLLLWAGLIAEDPTLEPKDVNEILDGFLEAGGDRIKVVNSMMEALQLSEVLGGGKQEKEAGKEPIDVPAQRIEAGEQPAPEKRPA